MSALLALLLAAPGWFRAVQYAPRPVTLRGCSECRGEKDDQCAVPRGMLQLDLDEYARDRWPAPGRLKLLRSKADPDCAVKSLGAVELLAVRLAAAPPSDALLGQAGAPVQGWPRAPRKRTSAPAVAPRGATSVTSRGPASVREGLVCWPSETGWPLRAALDSSNACEWWLLAVKDGGEPDLAGWSFPLGAAFPFGDARWARAFDRAAPLEEVAGPGGGGGSKAGAVAGRAAVAAGAGAEAAGSGVAAGDRVAGAAADGAAGQGDGAVEAARPVGDRPSPAERRHCAAPLAARAGTLDRFDQWDARVRGAKAASLDRAAAALDASAWSGHCQELDVLRAALEQQLGCALETRGACASPP